MTATIADIIPILKLIDFARTALPRLAKRFNNRAYRKIEDRSSEAIMRAARILFIDDRSFRIGDILKGYGWLNVSTIRKVHSLDMPVIVNAHIVFIDIEDVAVNLFPADHGLGLISALRDLYPCKILIIYSAQSGKDSFNSAWDKADDKIHKDSDPSQFVALIKKYSERLLSRKGLVDSIRQALLHNTRPVVMSENQIARCIIKARTNGRHTSESVGDAFRIGDTAIITTLLSIFYGNE